MAVDMLCAYYGPNQDDGSLFDSTLLAGHDKWDQYFGSFDVLRLVITDYLRDGVTIRQGLDRMQQLLVRELVKSYPDVDYFDKEDLLQTMEDIYAEYDRQFVIIIDEWDAVFRARKEEKEGQQIYLDFLRNWLKDKSYVALAYMTGILPIKKYGQHSALNMFDEYSMITPMQLAPYTGFTEQEVRCLSEQYNMSYEDISAWYDGYIVSDRIPIEERAAYRAGKYEGHKIAIYSPLSVVNAMSTGLIRNYWNRTETYEALAEYIRRDYDGLKESVTVLIDGGRVKVDVSGYQNDMTTFHGRDDVLSLLIHLGYLGYDDDTREVFIPNREILDEFKTSTRSSEWIPVFRAFQRSLDLLDATWSRDERKVAEIVEESHDRTSNKSYNDETALSYAIQHAYYAAQKYYTVIQELDTGKGYADLVFLPAPQYPDKPALLIELKYNQSAHTALNQILDKNYPQKLEHYRGNLLLVGITYQKEIRSDAAGYKHHSCIIHEA